ncbi:MAG: hypothetical protein Q8P90_01490, partial [bacterium]|nr:hypothetical protein [bacterium]
VGDANALGLDVTTNGGNGINVTTTGAANGIDINVDSGQKALEANGGIINNQGAYLGGQFYPYQPPSNYVHQSVDARLLARISDPISPEDIVFDGSDIWVPNRYANSSVWRYNAIDGRLVKKYTMPFSGTKTLLFVESETTGPLIYAFTNSTNGAYQVIPLYDDALPAIGNVGILERIDVAVFDGDSIWLKTSANKIYDWDFEGTGVATLVSVGAVNPAEMLYADGSIWLADYGLHQLVKINPISRTATDYINIGTYGLDIEFDGQFIWVSHLLSDQLSRVNISTFDIDVISTTSYCDGPRELEFDGTKIWMQCQYDGRLISYNIAKQQFDDDYLVDAFVGWMAMTFDGTNIWALTSGNDILKVSTGTGMGPGASPVTKGQYLFGQDGNMYCVYVDGTGTLTSSTTLTNCQ